jgi:hypothetical protein
MITLVAPRTTAGPREQAHPWHLEVPFRTGRAGRRARRAERRRLERQDALSRRLAELGMIRGLLEQAVGIVRAGWVQGAWFTVAAPGGDRAVTTYDLRAAVSQPVTGACLVGSVVQAAGGPVEVRSQLVQRTLDVVWHALREDPGRPVRWCPGPCARMMHVLEMTFWNDAPGRTQDEVADLLVAARQTAEAQSDLCRAEQRELVPASAHVVRNG